jgi:hypothetical protein
MLRRRVAQPGGPAVTLLRLGRGNTPRPPPWRRCRADKTRIPRKTRGRRGGIESMLRGIDFVGSDCTLGPLREGRHPACASSCTPPPALAPRAGGGGASASSSLAPPLLLYLLGVKQGHSTTLGRWPLGPWRPLGASPKGPNDFGVPMSPRPKGPKVPMSLGLGRPSIGAWGWGGPSLRARPSPGPSPAFPPSPLSPPRTAGPTRARGVRAGPRRADAEAA